MKLANEHPALGGRHHKLHHMLRKGSIATLSLPSLP